MFRGRSHRRATKRVVRHERKEIVSLLSLYGKRQVLASDTLLKPELLFADCSVLHHRDDVKYEGSTFETNRKCLQWSKPRNLCSGGARRAEPAIFTPLKVQRCGLHSTPRFVHSRP